ncbi:GNAT family N-acetyltransferase [Qipengyuania gaetbuli]|uniref:GNAT family N-acetyltransferase n=1 Tax=Qipengyuania gaetbuli TaxID=266952 RepID=UPI001C99626C|nr:GNAT family N-acetyltransferase [Qipengyuania gaetbuli]MBY6016088.1 GNAT family N-acetyltransferase [Qipengyuania gaetbuli]
MGREEIQGAAGPNLRLRLIKPEDAAYVHRLRTDPSYNSHLSEVTGTVEDQRDWIEIYKARENAALELYYVIERKDGIPCGLVRLYDIEPDQFTWGSWILEKHKPPKAALESAVLSFGIGFHVLGARLANVDVRINNTHAAAFYRRFGMEEVRRTDGDIYFEYPRSKFDADRESFMTLLTKKVPDDRSA